MSDSLKFADPTERRQARRGEITSTVRDGHGLGIGGGDQLRLTDDAGHPFATARVIAAVETRLYNAMNAIHTHNGTHLADHQSQLEGILSKYYDDMDRQSPVTAIVFEVTEVLEPGDGTMTRHHIEFERVSCPHCDGDLYRAIKREGDDVNVYEFAPGDSVSELHDRL